MPTNRPWLTWFAVPLVMAAGWILFTASFHLHELLVGLFTVLAASVFFSVVRREDHISFEFTIGNLAACWRTPWYLLSGTYEITLLLARDLFRPASTGSYYRVSAFRPNGQVSRRAAGAVLATVYTTIAPNFIVIGIDEKQGRMIFHQLRRSTIPKMTKKLGAE